MQLGNRLELDSARENLQAQLDARWMNATTFTPQVRRAARLAARLSPLMPGGWEMGRGHRGGSPEVIIAEAREPHRLPPGWTTRGGLTYDDGYPD